MKYFTYNVVEATEEFQYDKSIYQNSMLSVPSVIVDDGH